MEDAGIAPDGSNIQETIEVDESKVGSEKELVSAEDVDLVEKVDSPTAKEQAKANPSITEVQPVKPSEEPVSPTALVGNAMYRYDGKAMKEDGYQVKRTGAKADDAMSKFFNWLDNAGINFQEVIDNELHAILKVNPKVQFLMVNPQENATNDQDMNDHVLEVVEYTPEVAKIHKEDKEESLMLMERGG